MQKADPAPGVSRISREDGVDGVISEILSRDIVDVCGVDATWSRDGERATASCAEQSMLRPGSRPTCWYGCYCCYENVFHASCASMLLAMHNRNRSRPMLLHLQKSQRGIVVLRIHPIKTPT
jgi:hypothetical protein